MDDIRLLLDFGRFLGVQKLYEMEAEAKSRCTVNELEDDDLESVSAAGEPVFHRLPKEDGYED